MPQLFDRRRKALLHVAFWLVYASFFFYQISFGRKGDLDWTRITVDFGFHMACLLGLSYINYFVFLPRFLRTQDLGAYLLRFAPVIAIGSYALLVGKRMIITQYLTDADWVNSTRFSVGVISSTILIVVFVGLLRFVEDYFQHEARRRELENATLSSELRFLRAQINPHFLFNTLNNLYFLAETQSPRTPEVIAKLADLMRYLLHHSNQALVPLDKEIEYMHNYIDLERLRLNDDYPIHFQVSGATAGARVVPLILVTFLENAFKHGIRNTVSVGANEDDDAEPAGIDISLDVQDGQLTFIVTNPLVAEVDKTVTEPSGIGLTNARRRLELGYPHQHTLHIEHTAQQHRVTLQIALT